MSAPIVTHVLQRSAPSPVLMGDFPPCPVRLMGQGATPQSQGLSPDPLTFSISALIVRVCIALPNRISANLAGWS